MRAYVTFQVSLNSSIAAIMCEYRHLSVFSAHVLVRPNHVNPLDLSLFLGIMHNAIVAALVIAAWCIFALMMVWASRKDRDDLRKV